jgi:hypothetical protein
MTTKLLPYALENIPETPSVQRSKYLELGVKKRLEYWLLKIRFGECPDCHMPLKKIQGWGRSDCPECKKIYH